jgi:hypothetical protein
MLRWGRKLLYVFCEKTLMQKRMRRSTTNFENFPWWIILTSNIVSIAIYVLGIFIMVQAGLLIAGFFLLYILFLEFRLIRTHCVNCYYWGKACAFGKGRISAFFFKPGDARLFCAKKMTWKDMIPDMLVLAVPIVTGIILLMIDFHFLLLLEMLFLILLSTFGNGYIRGQLACKHCIQKDLGCPAAQLFNNTEGKKAQTPA